jgi:hypothetical protein
MMKVPAPPTPGGGYWPIPFRAGKHDKGGKMRKKKKNRKNKGNRK